MPGFTATVEMAGAILSVSRVAVDPTMTAQKPETTNLVLPPTSLIHDFCGDIATMNFKRLTIDNEDSLIKSNRAVADDSRRVFEKYPNFTISVVCARVLPLTDCTYGVSIATDDSEAPAISATNRQ